MIALALMLAAGQAAPTPPSAMVLGVGNVTCGKWTTAIHDPRGTDRLIYSAWITGYITSADAMSAREGEPSLLEGLDADAVNEWVGNYCAAHPLDHISRAGVRLFTELATRRRSGL